MEIFVVIGICLFVLLIFACPKVLGYILCAAFVSCLFAFPISAILYWILTTATGIIALSYWSWFAIVATFLFIYYIFFSK